MKHGKHTHMLAAAGLVLFGMLALVGLSAYGARPAAALESDAGALRQDCPTVGGELLVFNWDGAITTSQHGFPGFDSDGIGDKTLPASCNTDWTKTPNYANGRLYFRVKINSMPVPQSDVKMQFCVWQKNSNESFRRENCSALRNPKVGGGFVQWDVATGGMWKKNGYPILWNKPRQWMRFAIKNGSGAAVSDWTSPKWGNENPAQWYPMNACLQVVAVPSGGGAPNWSNFPCASR